jgi:hypothetical protein
VSSREELNQTLNLPAREDFDSLSMSIMTSEYDRRETQTYKVPFYVNTNPVRRK